MLSFLETNIHLDFLMYLFPIVFLLHDGEEIWMVERWVRRHQDQIKFALDLRLIDLNKNITVQFAIAVLTIGSVLTLTTLWAIPHTGSKHFIYILFIGFVSVYLLDGMKHIGTSILLRSYTPGVATAAIVEVPFGAYALYRFHDAGMLDAASVAKGIAMALPLVLLLVATGLLLGGRLAPYRRQS